MRPFRRALFAGLLGCLLIGCVRTVVEPEKPRYHLFVGREPKRVTLTWDSKVGVLYSVQYKLKNQKKAVWKFLPNGTNIRGNGQRIQLVDKPPRGVVRSYRLHLPEESPRITSGN